MISFTQNLISIDKDNARICWIVENHTENVVTEAVAFSDLFSFRFGSLGIGSIKTVTFDVPVSKAGLLDRAVMNYFGGGQTHVVESNILISIS